jgi:branched-chain amino acid transport system permease protein
MHALADRSKALAPATGAAALRSLFPVTVGIGIAFLLQLVIRGWVGPYATKLLMDMGINVVLAVSLNLVNGFTGQFSIGHAGFMAVGGYVAGAITYYTSFSLWGGAATQGGLLGSGEWLFFAGSIAGGIVAGLLGYVVGLPSLRLRGDYLAIVTLGFGEITRILITRTNDVLMTAEQIRGAQPWTLLTHVGGALGFGGIPYYTNLFWVYAWVTVLLVVAYRLKESTYGRAFLSIREDEVAADAMGINITRYKVRAFVLAAFFAGIAGSLFAHEVGTTLNPNELGFQKSFDVVIMVVLGGMGSISGADIAAVVLTIVPEWLREFPQYRMIIYALLLVIMMIVRPQGLFGTREIWTLGLLRRWRRAEGGAS